MPGTVTRYSGLTKYDTNVQILKGFVQEYKDSKVYVANGETLVDALAGVPLAAADGAPVVLVNQQLEDATKEFLKLTMSTADIVVLGGEAVVSATVINDLTLSSPIPSDDPTVTPPVSNPTGGGGTPTTPTTPTKLNVTYVSALASDNVTRQIANGDTINFTGVNDSVRFTGLKLTTNQTSPDIVITSIRANGLELIKSGESFNSTIDSNGVVTTSALLAGLYNGSNGLSLQSLRSFLGTGDLVFKGRVTKNGYTDSDVLTVTIHLGARVS